MTRALTFWSCEPGVGRRTIALDVARELAEEESSVLVLRIGESALLPDEASMAWGKPEVWAPRFASLTPAFLRNGIANPDQPFTSMGWNQTPPPEVTRQALMLLRKAFDWIILLTSPDACALEVLDATDLLFWIARPSATLKAAHAQMLDRLSGLHYPHAHCQTLLNRTDASSIPAFQVIPDDAMPGLRRRRAVRQLVDQLRTQPELYRVRDTHGIEKAQADVFVQQLKNQVQPELLRLLDSQNESAGDAKVAQKTIETLLAAQESIGGLHEEREKIVTRVLEEVLGLGPLEPLLKDPVITEVMVNGAGMVFVEKKGRLHPTDVRFASEAQLRTVIDRIVAPIGRRVDESMPLCDARLLDGSRVNIVLPPLALDGPTVTIRKFSAQKMSLDDLIALGSLSPEMRDFLSRAVKNRKNIVVAGGTGSGKTTLLNALSGEIPDDERIVTIEDAAELKLQKPHVVRLEARPANVEGHGEISIRRLVMNALRMRPDRIVVGECRGGEALDMLQAMNTGHDGSLTTVHANSPRDALGRLETLVLMAGMDLPIRVIREQIRSAVHILVQQSRLADGARKVTSITQITGMEGDTLTSQELYRWKNGRFEATGMVAV